VGCRLRNFAAVATGLLGADVAFDIACQHYHVWSNGIMIRALATGVLAWPDRAWLALLAGTVPAERLAAMRLIVTPGTIVRWHRGIVRRRWTRLSRRGRSGRPATHRKVRSLVPQLARENESWEYSRGP
jgi:hypothetical protein